MEKKYNVQVKTEHYFKGYDSLHRFISYFYQVDSLRDLKSVKSVLEIGVGNKTVNNYLKTQGFKVISCDFDESLKPDVVADVRKMPFKDKSLIACFVLNF